MIITIKRIARKPKYTIGKVYINNRYFCDCIEDKDRGLTLSTPLKEIQKIKIPNETAIPTGKYKVTLDVVSPKYSKSTFYKTYANGAKVPRLIGVPGYEGVLIHTGNTEKDSAGCIIIGKNTVVGKVTDSKNTFIAFYKELLKYKNELIEINIV